MGSYTGAAEYYDLLYSQFKDYAAESSRLAAAIVGSCSGAHRILDVGCGTGRHAEGLTAAGFAVDGLDLEPEFVRIAAARNPSGRFRVGDMTAFAVREPYDAVLCLFGAVAYARDEVSLRACLRCLAEATRVGGVVIVEPFLEPNAVKDGHVMMHSARDADVLVCRMSRMQLRGGIGSLEFEYLVGRPSGIERISERHDMGLFDRATMDRAFREAGLAATYDPEGLIGRGLYVASKTP